MKSIEQYVHVVLFIMLYKVVLTFTSVGETVMCDHSNESYWAVLSCGTVYYAVLSLVINIFIVTWLSILPFNQTAWQVNLICYVYTIRKTLSTCIFLIPLTSVLWQKYRWAIVLSGTQAYSLHHSSTWFVKWRRQECEGELLFDCFYLNLSFVILHAILLVHKGKTSWKWHSV